MTCCHIFIQIKVASVGRYNELSLVIAFYSAIALLQAIPWAIDWWTFRKREIQESLSVTQRFWRLVAGATCAAFVASYVFGTFHLFLGSFPPHYYATGALHVTWYSAGAVLFFIPFWNRTTTARIDEHSVILNVELRLKMILVAVLCKVGSLIAYGVSAMFASWAVTWLAIASIAYVLRRELGFTTGRQRVP